MFCVIVGVLLLSQYVFYNYGHICLRLIQTYSRIQMSLRKQKQKQITKDDLEWLECFVGRHIVHYAVDNTALHTINNSDFAVLVNKKNMIMFYPPLDEYFPEYEVSNVEFISVQVSIGGGSTYDIKLKTADHSFYVVGNELNVDFVRYYILRTNNVWLPSDVEYTMTIVDDNVQFHEINQCECLAIEKDTYHIFRYEEEEEAQEGEDDYGLLDYEDDEERERDGAEEKKPPVGNNEIEEVEYIPIIYTRIPECDEEEECPMEIEQLLQVEDDMRTEMKDLEKYITEFDQFDDPCTFRVF